MFYRLIFALLLMPATAFGQLTANYAGSIDDKSLDEISGLAPSTIGDRLWVINDNGHPATVTAIDLTGRTIGAINLDGVQNQDWEDLDSFVFENRHYLLIADTGDNDSKHGEYYLHVVEEPTNLSHDTTASPAWTIRFRYPNRFARDCEAVAVDVSEGRVYLLSKRGFPSTLYGVDLFDRNLQIAERLTEVRSIPQPTAEDIERDPRLGRWIGQPTALSLAKHGAVLLTYRHAYWYPKGANDTWASALTSTPMEIKLPRLHLGEALTVMGKRIYLTSEEWPAPLLWIDAPRSTDTSP